MNRKIIFMTKKSPEGLMILDLLLQAEIPLAAVVIEDERFAPLRGKATLKKTVARHGWRETVRLWAKKVRRRLFGKTSQDWSRRDTYRSRGGSVYFVDNVNGSDCQALLERLAPDLIVLGRSRILRQPIIRIPRVGILNGHPGLLPRYRGVDVVRWAIYNDDALGVTVHFVDEGVDTGRIIAREPIEIGPEDTIRRLKKKANQRAGALLAAVVRAWLETGNMPSVKQEPAAGEQFYRMPAPLRQETDRRLEERMKDTGDTAPLAAEERNK